MLNKFNRWFYHSPYGFIAGLIVLGVVSTALYLALFGGEVGVVDMLIGALIGSAYTAVYNKTRDKHLKSHKD